MKGLMMLPAPVRSSKAMMLASFCIALILLHMFFRPSWDGSFNSPPPPPPDNLPDHLVTAPGPGPGPIKGPSNPSHNTTHDQDELILSPTPTHPPEPPKPVSRIPKKIWYKKGKRERTLDMLDWEAGCLHRNPGYTSQVMDDEQSDEFVRTTYADHKELLDIYLSLTVPILKADIFRYLVLYHEGGIWFDLDVSCGTVPIDDWIPKEYKENTGLVVGWEFDSPYGANAMRQINSWTILAEPKSPHLWQVVEDIIQRAHEIMEQNNVTASGIKMDMVDDVVLFTGPIRFTGSLWKSLEHNYNHKVDVLKYANLTQPALIEDTVLLPGFSLAASMNRYPEGTVVGPSLVIHHYAGSWKNAEGGESV